MYTETYTALNGATQYRPIFESTGEYLESDNMGLCLACGAEAFNVEPDASKYTCESCQQPKVYGFEQLLLMGIARLSDDFDDE